MIIYIHSTRTDINNYIIQEKFTLAWCSFCFYQSNINDEFLTLLKVKFGDNIRYWDEICNDPLLAYYYARFSLNKRFPEGEAAIFKHPKYRELYTNRFPK